MKTENKIFLSILRSENLEHDMDKDPLTMKEKIAFLEKVIDYYGELMSEEQFKKEFGACAYEGIDDFGRSRLDRHLRALRVTEKARFLLLSWMD